MKIIYKKGGEIVNNLNDFLWLVKRLLIIVLVSVGLSALWFLVVYAVIVLLNHIHLIPDVIVKDVLIFFYHLFTSLAMLGFLIEILRETWEGGGE